MKKNISITLALILALSAFCTGCSSESSSTAEPQAAETQAAETETAETEAAETQAAETQAPAQETEAAETETAAETSGALSDQDAADTWSLISGYGFYDGTCDDKDISYSNLSFTLKSDTVQDLGDTYSVEAEIYKNVQVPADLEEGEETTFTIDEKKGTTVTVVCRDGELVNVDDDSDTYYCSSADASGQCTLMQFSDDAVCDYLCDGKLIIRKDATYGVAIMNEYQTLEESSFSNDPWFNGVAFDDNGEVTALVFFGD